MANETTPRTLARSPASSGTLRLRPEQARAERRGGTGAPATAAHTGQRSLDSDALLQGRSHVSIEHHGATYQLRATRLGKLILTK